MGGTSSRFKEKNYQKEIKQYTFFMLVMIHMINVEPQIVKTEKNRKAN